MNFILVILVFDSFHFYFQIEAQAPEPFSVLTTTSTTTRTPFAKLRNYSSLEIFRYRGPIERISEAQKNATCLLAKIIAEIAIDNEPEEIGGRHFIDCLLPEVQSKK